MTDRGAFTWARASQIGQAFLDGFVESSRAAFFAMLAGMGLMIALAAWYFSYATLSGPSGAYLARSSADVDGHATYRALQLGGQVDNRPTVLILGSSVSASAFAFEDLTAEAISNETGQDWRVGLLTTALQSPVDQFALIETALQSADRKTQPVVIVLGVDVTLNGWTPEKILEIDSEPRLGIRSDWADDEIARLGGTPRPRSSFYIAENWRFFIVNGGKAMMRFLTRTAAVPRLDIFAPDENLPRNQRDGDLIANQIRTSFKPDNDGILESLRVLSDHLDSFDNARLILLHELPSPDLVKDAQLEDIIAAERARYIDFAQEIGAQYWSPFTELNIPAEAFHDSYHIGQAVTQQRLRAALARQIADLTRDGNDG